MTPGPERVAARTAMWARALSPPPMRLAIVTAKLLLRTLAANRARVSTDPLETSDIFGLGDTTCMTATSGHLQCATAQVANVVETAPEGGVWWVRRVPITSR